MKLWILPRRDPIIGTMCVILFFEHLLLVTGSDENDCDRANSRHVQKIIETEIFSAYEKVNAKVPPGCPLDVGESMYAAVEKMKYKEHPSKWICYQCGKSFYEERFIDRHMERRHEFLKKKGSDVLCLADVCNIFRCEVIASDAQPEYWTRVLCNEQLLQHRRDACQELIAQCVPSYLEHNDKKVITDALNDKLCKYLNCKDYWVLPQLQMNPLSTALYVMAFMVISVGLFIYYYVAYTHFYTDDSILEQFKADEKPRSKRHVKYPPVPGREDLRYRQTVSR